jgi:hypothetical protein
VSNIIGSPPNGPRFTGRMPIGRSLPRTSNRFIILDHPLHRGASTIAEHRPSRSIDHRGASTIAEHRPSRSIAGGTHPGTFLQAATFFLRCIMRRYSRIAWHLAPVPANIKWEAGSR